MLIKKLQTLITDLEFFLNGKIKFIGHYEYPYADCTAKDFHTYSDWQLSYYNYPVIKIEGLEKFGSIRSLFPNLTIANIHLFVNTKKSLSFNWHKDDVNVYLKVLKGSKVCEFRKSIICLKSGQSIYIAKGLNHRVRSSRDTWALSVGCR